MLCEVSDLGFHIPTFIKTKIEPKDKGVHEASNKDSGVEGLYTVRG